MKTLKISIIATIVTALIIALCGMAFANASAEGISLITLENDTELIYNDCILQTYYGSRN